MPGHHSGAVRFLPRHKIIVPWQVINNTVTEQNKKQTNIILLMMFFWQVTSMQCHLEWAQCIDLARLERAPWPYLESVGVHEALLEDSLQLVGAARQLGVVDPEQVLQQLLEARRSAPQTTATTLHTMAVSHLIHILAPCYNTDFITDTPYDARKSCVLGC